MAGGEVNIVAPVQGGRHLQPVLVDRKADDTIGHRAKNIARIGVSGIFHADRCILAQKQLGEQIERLLRADRYNDFIRAGPDAAPGQNVKAQLVDQFRIITIDQIPRPIMDFKHAQRAARAFPPIIRGKEARIKLAIEKRVLISKPFFRLHDITTGRRCHREPPVPRG